MSINPGLTSRFPETLLFRGLDPNECIKLFAELMRGQKRKLQQKKRDLDMAILESPRKEFLEKLLDQFQVLSNLPNWANARDIQTVAKGVFGKTIRAATASSGRLTVDEEIIMAGIDAMIAERAHRGHIPISDPRPPVSAAPRPLPEQLHSLPVAPITRSAQIVSVQKDRPAAPPASQDAQPTTNDPQRDAGVSDEVWERLEQDKAAAQASEQKYKELLEQEAAAAAKRKIEAVAAAARDEAARHALDDEAKRRHEEARLQHELERRAREAELAALQRERQAEEERRRKEREAQRKLRDMGVCCAGFRWIKQEQGYRCAGGSHYVSNAQLGLT